MKRDIINPITLKGKDMMGRIKELMGESVDKTTKNYVVELTKKGPDNNTYAIIRENKQYFIKITNKTKNIISEDFEYIGGLENKMSYAYPTYSKAIRQLNLKFINLSEACDNEGIINTFSNDNLISERTDFFKNEESLKEVEELDKVGEEDDDIDNDGEENDPNDLYIKNKRMKIGDAISDVKKKI